MKSAGRLPSEGSVREAVILGVWLRHQEIEANKVSVMANGLVSGITGNAKSTAEAFRAVIEGMFPFMLKTKGLEDKELIDKMKQEVDKGKLYFSPVVTKPLRNMMKKFDIPDEFKQKLQARARKKTE